MSESGNAYQMEKSDPLLRMAVGLNPRFSLRAYRLCREAEGVDVVFGFTDCEIWVTELLLRMEKDLEKDEFVLSWLVLVMDHHKPDAEFHVSFSNINLMKLRSPRGLGEYIWEDIARMHEKLFL